jgi:hypothetical protein
LRLIESGAEVFSFPGSTWERVLEALPPGQKELNDPCARSQIKLTSCIILNKKSRGVLGKIKERRWWFNGESDRLGFRFR